MVPPPGVQWREPLHYFWVLIGYDIVHVDGIVVVIHQVIAVDIVVTKRDRVPIGYVVHGVQGIGVRRA